MASPVGQHENSLAISALEQSPVDETSIFDAYAFVGPEQPASLDTRQTCEAANGDAAQNRTALRIAADMMQGGYWWTAQEFPPAHQDALSMLSESVGVQATVFGDDAISTFESATRCLAPATDGVDPAWVDSEYAQRVKETREELERRSARMQVDEVQESARGSASGESADLEGRLDELAAGFQSAEDFLTLRNAALGRKIAQQIDWESLPQTTISDPLTGRSFSVKGGQVLDWIVRAKSALRLATADGTQDAPAGSTAGRAAQQASHLKNVVQGTTSLAALACEGFAWVLRREAAFVTDAAQASARLAMAEDCVSISRGIAASKGITGTLAALDLIRHVATIADPDASAEGKVEAVVGAATAAANLGAAVGGTAANLQMVTSPFAATAATAATWCTATSVAIPVGWLTFKASLRTMHETKISIAAGLMVQDFERLVEAGNSAQESFSAVTTAQLLATEAPSPSRATALQEVARERALAVSAQLAQMPATAGFRWNTLRGELDDALRHPGATGTCNEPAVVADAVSQVNRRISLCLKNAADLIYEELGFRKDEASDISTSALTGGGPLGPQPEAN